MTTGGTLTRLNGDIDAAAGRLQMAFASPIISLSRLGVGIGVLITVNSRLALAALALTPSAVVISMLLANRIRPIYLSVRHDQERIDGRVGEVFSGIRVIRAFGCEARELLEYVCSRHAAMRKEFFAHRRELALSMLFVSVVGSANVILLWYGGYLHTQGRASIGDIVAFPWYTLLLAAPIWSMVNSFSDLQRALASMERVFHLLAVDIDKPHRPDARVAPRVVEQVRFEHVEFEYERGRPVVRNFDVTVAAGSVVALVGRSGAGKTTVTDLLARFHDPTRGRILVNGYDIRDFRLRSYRDLIAIVEQHVFLFDGSVRDNIAYGRRRNVTRSEIEEAAQRANAHGFIMKLPVSTTLSSASAE